MDSQDLIAQSKMQINEKQQVSTNIKQKTEEDDNNLDELEEQNDPQIKDIKKGVKLFSSGDEEEVNTDNEYLVQALPIDESGCISNDEQQNQNQREKNDINNKKSSEDLQSTEYLMSVRQQALSISNIMVAKKLFTSQDVQESNCKKLDISENVMSIFEKFDKLNVKTMPIQLFQDQQQSVVENFSKLKEQIYNLRSLPKEQLKQYIDFPENYQHQYSHLVNNYKSFIESYTNNVPQLYLILQLDYINTEKFLEWINQYTNKNLNNNSYYLTYNQQLWFYAMLSLLELPLLSDISSYLQNYAKVILKCLGTYSKNYKDYELYISMGNQILIIIREYFHQKNIYYL